MRNYARATTAAPVAHLLAYAKFALRIRRVWRKVVAAAATTFNATRQQCSPLPPGTASFLFCFAFLPC